MCFSLLTAELLIAVGTSISIIACLCEIGPRLPRLEMERDAIAIGDLDDLRHIGGR
jgi:hypothetical protein